MSSQLESPTWTGRVRQAPVAALPPERLLPDTQPIYVASWIYVFGVLTLAALVVVLASGAVIALAGPAWWHTSSVGHFFNSMHLWGHGALLLLLHGRAPLGQVLHGGVARPACSDLGHRGRLLPRLHRDGVHRVPDPAEPRLAVDRGPGEGRSQRGRDRRLLQRPQLRPDAAVARPPAPAGRRAPLSPATSSSCAAAEWFPRRERRPVSAAPLARGGMDGSQAPIRPREGSHDRDRRSHAPDRGALLFSSPDVKPVTVSQWAAAAPKDFLQTAVAELDGASGVATYG